MPHNAFNGHTPDEMYFGTGDALAETLITERRVAREDRFAANRALTCGTCCPPDAEPPLPEPDSPMGSNMSMLRTESASMS
jgi:putative transposase